VRSGDYQLYNLTLHDLHPGLREWLRQRTGLPSLFPNFGDMPAEMAAVFELCHAWAANDKPAA
jgi:hypothetical protein